MTIGQIVVLKIMPQESWEVIDIQGDRACLRNVGEPRLGIWARENEIMSDELPDKYALVRDFLKSTEKFVVLS